jgi:chromosome segregation ATPase
MSEQGRSSLQQNCDIDSSKSKAANEEVTKQLKQVKSEKDEEILILAKSIEFFEGENKILWDVKSQLSKNIQSLNTENENISAELLTKSEAVASLEEQNSKLAIDLATIGDEKMQAIKDLEEEKINCFKESEKSQNTLLKEISNLKDSVFTLEEEKKILETKMEDQINSLSIEQETQLQSHEDSKSQLNAELEAEKHEKSVILAEKISLVDVLKAIQLEKDQFIKDLQETKINKEICNKEKVEGNSKLRELNTKIIAVSEDMSKFEAENKEISEKLLKVESEKVQGSKKLQEMENRFSVLSQENSKLESECKVISEQLAKMKTKKVEE